MEGGCDKIPAMAELKKTDEAKHKAVCQGIREDGAYIEAGENDVLIVRKLEANKNAFGIFGYSFLEQNADKVQGSLINGVERRATTISLRADTRSPGRCSSTSRRRTSASFPASRSSSPSSPVTRPGDRMVIWRQRADRAARRRAREVAQDRAGSWPTTSGCKARLARARQVLERRLSAVSCRRPVAARARRSGFADRRGSMRHAAPYPDGDAARADGDRLLSRPGPSGGEGFGQRRETCTRCRATTATTSPYGVRFRRC